MMTFTELKRKALEQYFSKMNEMQKKAVFKVKGPVLILAGAGSGKTTVLINRIANMIHFGNAYYDTNEYSISDNERMFLENFANGVETDYDRLRDIIAVDCVKPWSILAITFTNKAANELKERLNDMLGDEAEGIRAATFHSACIRILRRECANIGFENNFTIYDSDDSLRTIKLSIQDLDLSEKMFPPRAVLSAISSHKDKMVSPEAATVKASGDYKALVIAKIYKRYQQRLKDANAMDFDDIILYTVRLFKKYPDVLDHYQNLYKYILVDEYQDTNTVQYKLISLLSEKFGNLCVVGDDDQSIYKFRGATIENILNFEDQYPDSMVIRLEQNYRSTQNILSGANHLIKHNDGRKGKNLWTDKGDGKKICVYKSINERSEGAFIADTILNNVNNGRNYNNHAILYRMNAQSNVIEQVLASNGIPYRIYGGLKFYDRKEIKDILAYLSVINNNNDLLRLRRIINEPKRKIGDATVALLEQITSDLRISPVETMRQSAELAPLVKKSVILRELAQVFDELTDMSTILPLDELLDELLERTGYKKYMESLGDEGVGRLENINELKTTMATYAVNAPEPSLSGFLEEIALYTDLDTLDENADYVTLMTMHAAKGLEFPVVFVVGMEENIFPSARCMDFPDEIEEERRLAYVAITRAKEELYLTHAYSRMLFGRTNNHRVSRFIKELPADLLEKTQENGLNSALNSSPVQSGYSNMSLKAQIARSSLINGVGKNNQVTEVFKVGQRVKHRIFGEGMVTNAVPMSNDTMLEVVFDKVGTKKLMANFAKLKHVE